MRSTSHNLLSYLRMVVGAWRDDPRDDATLLVRFAEFGDEVAFAVLVWRHGPMVWQTCRRILGDTPDAEDAFQAAFLALAGKASRLTIENPAGWLQRVARRAALDAEAGSRRRRALEQLLRAQAQSKAEEETSRAELYTALDEELARLSERLRAPLLLHYFEGKSQVEVARLLNCSRSAIQYRLARAETALRKRLERRGLAMGIVSISSLLVSPVAASAVPARLIGSTARAAIAFRSGILLDGAAEGARAALRSLSFPLESSTSAALAEGVMKTMLVTKMKIVAVLLGVTLCLVGGGVLAYQALAGNATEPPQLADETRGDAEAPSQPSQPGAAARVDCYGDPLPAGALARMGTTRLWSGIVRAEPKALVFSPDGKTLATHIDGLTVCLWDTATGKEIRRLTTKTVIIKGQNWLPQIVSLGFSLDGKTLIAMDSYQTVYRWEAATGKFLHRQEYQGPKKDDVQSLTVAFLPNGKMLGFGDFLKSAEQGRGMYVWDITTGKEICQLGGPMKKRKDSIRVRAFSPDRKLLATALQVGDARIIKVEDKVKTVVKTVISLWDVATGKEVHQLCYEDDYVSAVAFSADGKTLASGGFKKICVWEVATGKKIHRLEAEEGGCVPLAYSPDGKTLLMGMAGQLWDAGTGKKVRSFGFKSATVALFSTDGKVLAVGDNAGAISLWEVATGKEISPRKGYRGRIRSVAYSPDGKILACMGEGEDEMIRLWKVATGKEMRPLAKHINAFGGQSKSIAYSPDDKMLVSREGNVLHLWDTVTGKEIRQFKGDAEADRFMSVAFSPDGKNLAVNYIAYNNNDQVMVRLWEVATGKRILWEIPDPETNKMKKIYALESGSRGDGDSNFVFSPDGRLLAVPGPGNTVSLLEVATSKRIGQLGRPGKPAVRSIAFSPDGRMLAMSSRGNDKVCLWEMATGKEIEIWQLNGLENNWGCLLAFSPDSRMLAIAPQGANWAGNPYSEVHLWDVPSGSKIGQLTGHRGLVQALAFSPDGKTLASGSDDLTCLVWDVTSVGRLKPVPAQLLSKEQLETAWADLAKTPDKAYAAIGVLQAVPAQAISLLQARVRFVDPADFQQLPRWIADLDSDSFAVREKAQQKIVKLGDGACPTLRKALKGQPSVETRRRLKDLLAELEPRLIVVSPDRLRELRAVQVLELIGTAEARQVLHAWAKGVTGARLTQEAQAAQAHLAKRSAAKP